MNNENYWSYRFYWGWKTMLGKMVKSLKLPLWNADEEVHLLLHQKALQDIIHKEILQSVFLDDKAYFRQNLRKATLGNFEHLKKMEAILAPYLTLSRKNFMKKAFRARQEKVIWEVPLLFEKKRHLACQEIWVAAATPFLRRKRVLLRQGMEKESLQFLEENQMKAQKKRALAGKVLYSGLGKGDYFRQLCLSLSSFKGKNYGCHAEITSTRNYIGRRDDRP